MLTDITVLLDRSGSMGYCKEDVEGGFDAFIKKQKEIEGKATITLYQFDTEYEKVYESKDLKDVPPLNLDPRGMTALLDSTHKTIIAANERINALTTKPDKKIIVIITDGHENASREVQKDVVTKQIATAKEDNWDFVFLGADEEGIQNAKDMGIQTSMSFHNTSGGYNHAFTCMSSGIACYRNSIVNWNEEFKNQPADDKE